MQGMYLHCGSCVRDPARHTSMGKYQRYSVMSVPHGLQIWCERHQCNVVVFEFDWGDEAPKCNGCQMCKPGN